MTVDGLSRSALVFPGTGTSPCPVVFVFHGHYGTARQAARTYRFHEAWPEATVVYPQGLPNMSKLVGYGNGWQNDFGDDGDRDLHFVKALVGKIESDFRGDPQHLYATGISNGAAFNFLLLTALPNTFRAFAPVAGTGGMYMRQLTAARPVFMINGQSDRLVQFRWAVTTRDYLIKVNGCSPTPTSTDGGYVVYKGPANADVAWHEHSGGHQWPDFATREIVRFFKDH
jgi:polyhydroxybutyrate depolymerase